MRNTLLTILSLFLFLMPAIAQNWSGVYECVVEANDYKVTLEAKIHDQGGEFWADISATGSENFTIEAWSVVNDDYIDFYYSEGNNDYFKTPNVHLFTLNGNKQVPNTSFGKGMIDAVKHVLGKKFILKGKSTPPKPKPKAVAPKPVAKPTPPPTKPTITQKQPVSPSKPVTTPPVSRPVVKPAPVNKEKLLVGKWEGEEASQITKYFDYHFMEGGTGMRDNKAFKWSLKDNILSLTWLTPLSEEKFNDIRRKADRFDTFPTYNIYHIDSESKSYKIDQRQTPVLQIGATEKWRIDKIDGQNLQISIQNSRGRWTKTYHIRG